LRPVVAGIEISGGSRGEARGFAPPLILGKKTKDHRRMKSRQGKKKNTPPLSP